MAQSSLYHLLCQETTLYNAWKSVKQKNASGGIDGITVQEFEEKLHFHMGQIITTLKAGKWQPEPYLRIEIPKKENEKRQLGLLSVKDKIVQQAIKNLIEPRMEKMFLNNSYGYRPGKGHTKAIHRTLTECRVKKNKWLLRLDIDNYFDTINHDLLTTRLHAIIPDEEIVRLIMLCVKMGVVSKTLNWQDMQEGIPQGAVISPLLANLYLHSFDQFVVFRTKSYIRYADDFIIFCETQEQAEKILQEATHYLSKRLYLTLNTPVISEIERGVEFLGITITKQGLTISENKEKDLQARIQSLRIESIGFTSKSIQSWEGISRYYGKLLPQEILVRLDTILFGHLQNMVKTNYKHFSGKAVLLRTLEDIAFLSNEYQLKKKRFYKALTDQYSLLKGTDKTPHTNQLNHQAISKRKQEYRKREGEGCELIVNTFGSFIGITRKGITVKKQGKIIYQKPINALSHITVTGQGISLSSNLIDYCMNNKITIDFFTPTGKHTGSVLSTKYMENTLWNKQATCGSIKRAQLAALIITGKLKNQFNLVKYFHKYHKLHYSNLNEKYLLLEESIHLFLEYTKNKDFLGTDHYLTDLIGYEAQGAIHYWAYIRELLQDDQVQFEKREHQGATDLVNSMLNYGYAILYVRVWQALLGAKLNPFDSIIHVRQNGKPTFVYDVVELFRAQVVDRMVISLIQKGLPLKVQSNGLLEENTKKQVAQSILERLNRYEKYRKEERKMEQIIQCQTREIAQMIEENKMYKPYIAKW